MKRVGACEQRIFQLEMELEMAVSQIKWDVVGVGGLWRSLSERYTVSRRPLRKILVDLI